jgi:spoIIIJ-associated protein
MSQQTYEAKGATVEEAIANGLTRLGVGRDAVAIEVLDEGSKGFLGLGSREAAVRLTVKSVQSKSAPPVVPPPVTATPVAPTPAAPASKVITPADEATAEADMALEVTRNLLKKMGVKAEVSVRYTEADDVTGEKLPIMDVRGRDLGVLVGSRGEILDAFQYIARLMVGNALHQRARFLVDIESYRDRREQALSRLAERMADKAVKSGRPTTLEVMPANERRIIHMALRERADVTTRSDGEGAYRRVRIYPSNT